MERGPVEEPGRPARALADDLDRYYAMGVMVRTDSLTGVLVDVNGEALAEAGERGEVCGAATPPHLHRRGRGCPRRR